MNKVVEHLHVEYYTVFFVYESQFSLVGFVLADAERAGPDRWMTELDDSCREPRM